MCEAMRYSDIVSTCSFIMNFYLSDNMFALVGLFFLFVYISYNILNRQIKARVEFEP